MSKAECLKILLAHKKQSYVVDCGCRRRVVPPIKDRQLGDRAARAINAEYLFAPVGRAFEYADVAGLNHVKSRARFTLAKYHLSRRVMAGQRCAGSGNPTRFPSARRRWEPSPAFAQFWTWSPARRTLYQSTSANKNLCSPFRLATLAVKGGGAPDHRRRREVKSTAKADW